MCAKMLSIQAWSVGVPGRPKCCAIAHMAMRRVEQLVISGPLSETASSTGDSPFWAEGLRLPQPDANETHPLHA
jgi:hypothetical protein